MPRSRSTRGPRDYYLVRAAGALLLIGRTPDLLAQTQSTWLSPAAGQFTDATKWSTNPYYPTNGNPVGTTYDATIAAAGPAYTVTLGTDVSLGTLTVGGTAALRHTFGLVHADRLVIDGPSASYTINGAGTPLGLDARTVRLNDGGSLAISFGRRLTFAGNVTVEGQGTFNFFGSSPLATVEVAGATTLDASLSFTGGGPAYFTGPGTLVNRGSIAVGLSELASNNLLVETPSFVNFGTITSRSAQISHLTNNAGALIQTSGLISDLVANAGTLRVDAGSALTIAGTITPDRIGNIESTGGKFVFNSTLDLANADYTVPAGAGNFVVAGTLRNGTLRNPGPAALTLAGTPTLSGVTLGGAVTLADTTTVTSNGTLAFDGATLTMRAGVPAQRSALLLPAAVTGTGTIVFGSHDSTVNTIAPAPGLPTSTLAPGITISTGVGGGVLGTATQPLHVLGTVNCSTGALTINGPGWTVDTLNLSGSAALHLAGSFTTATLTSALHRTGGTLIIDGTLNNSGSTLDLADTGNLSLAGTIQGGTLTSSNGSILKASSFATLDAVTLDLDWDVKGSGTGTLRFKNGLTLANDHTITFGLGSKLTGTSAITGAGTLLLNNDGAVTSSTITAGSIGPGVTVRTGANLTHSNSIRATLDAALYQGVVSVETDGFTVSLGGTNWVHTGTLSASAGTLALAGSFSPSSVGHVVRTGSGVVVVNGTLNMPDTDNTLLLDASTGSWNFAASTVNGGTIRTADGAAAVITATPAVLGGTTFQGVTAAGLITITPGGTLDTGATGLTLDDATIAIGAPGTVATSAATFRGPLLGTGQLTFVTNGGLVTPTASSYTYAPTISFITNGGTGTIGAIGQSITTQGAILAQNGSAILLAASDFTNAGQITATNGGIIGLNPATFVNHGSLDLTSGAVDLIGNFTTASYRLLSLPPTSLLIGGSLDNSGDSLTSTPATPVTLLANTTITGGTITGPADAPVTVYAPTLTNVTLAGAISLAGAINPGSKFTLAPGTSVNLLSPSGDKAVLVLSSNVTVAGALDVGFSGNSSLGTVQPLTGSLTIPADFSIRTGTQGGAVGVSLTTALTVNGVISAQTAGKSITLTGSPIKNNGTLEAKNGGAILTSGGFTNAGLITISSSSAVKISGTLTNTGRLDFAGGVAILNYSTSSPINTARAQLLTGRNGGTWDAPTGFTSTAAAADPRLAVAYAESSQLLRLTELQTATWFGQSVDATAVLLTLTYYGDANINGRIDPDDYALLDRSYAKSLTNAHWTDGDFNYDGTVDQQDYLLIDRTYTLQSGAYAPDAALLVRRESQFGPAYVSDLIASIPEPPSLLAACGFAVAPFARRRIGRSPHPFSES